MLGMNTVGTANMIPRSALANSLVDNVFLPFEHPYRVESVCVERQHAVDHGVPQVDSPRSGERPETCGRMAGFWRIGFAEFSRYSVWTSRTPPIFACRPNPRVPCVISPGRSIDDRFRILNSTGNRRASSFLGSSVSFCNSVVVLRDSAATIRE